MKQSSESLMALRKSSETLNQSFKPEFFRLKGDDDRERFFRLLDTPGLTVVDQIRDQIKELIKSKNPSVKFSTNQLEEKINLAFENDEEFNYGVWVYYPWSKRLIHILDKEDFIFVRTSRNQYKISPEEKDELAQKKIGVIGLSVGQSVSVTLIMERICGEIRLADFDVLELTNLNRIRTGIHNLGLPKVYSVAREISEIDPFITVKCFSQGLTDQNMDSFFLDGGRLDLVVEESDGFDIKILCRYKARELGVPVLMEASDRCMVDVERFDLEPQRPILHGMVKHLDIATLKSLTTNEEKIPYMLDVLGLESTSVRLRASMLEMQQTITTWPQLASAVTMGGGITADVARRLLLNQFRSSGRFYVDVEKIICDQEEERHYNGQSHQPVQDTPTVLQETTKFSAKKGTALSKDVADKIVKAGCFAPSAGNMQPWRWLYQNNTLYVFNALFGDKSLIGFNNMSSHMAIGSAAMNVILQAEQFDLDTNFEIFTRAGKNDPVMAFHFSPLSGGKKHKALASVIEYRHTNRMLGKRQQLTSDVLHALQSTIKNIDDNLGVKFITDSHILDQAGKLLGELEKLRLLDPKGHHEFVSEIRWTEEENQMLRDGVDLNTLDLSNSEKIGLLVARDPQVMAMVNKWNGGGAFARLSQKAVEAAAAIGVLYAHKKIDDCFIKGGMAMQKLWLEATLHKIGIQPMAAPVFMFAPVMNSAEGYMSEQTGDKLRKLRPDFEKIFGLQKDQTEIFIFRMAIAPEPKARSLRKPLDEVFLYKD